MTLTFDEVRKRLGPCPGCGCEYEITEEMRAAAETMGKQHGFKLAPGSLYCDACMQASLEELVESRNRERRARLMRWLDYTGLWPRDMQAMTFAASEARIEGHPRSTRHQAYKKCRQWDARQGCVWLWSESVGVGKTYLAAAMCNEQLRRGRHVAVLRGSQLGHLAKGWDSGDKLARYERADVVLLDDLDKAPKIESVAAALFQVLDVRHASGRPTIVTANAKRSAVLAAWEMVAQHGLSDTMAAALDRLAWPDKPVMTVEIKGGSVRGRLESGEFTA